MSRVVHINFPLHIVAWSLVHKCVKLRSWPAGYNLRIFSVSVRTSTTLTLSVGWTYVGGTSKQSTQIRKYSSRKRTLDKWYGTYDNDGGKSLKTNEMREKFPWLFNIILSLSLETFETHSMKLFDKSMSWVNEWINWKTFNCNYFLEWLYFTFGSILSRLWWLAIYWLTSKQLKSW